MLIQGERKLQKDDDKLRNSKDWKNITPSTDKQVISTTSNRKTSLEAAITRISPTLLS